MLHFQGWTKCIHPLARFAGSTHNARHRAQQSGAGGGCARAVIYMNLLSDFIQRHQITEVECLVPDMSGIARGKILPAEKFLRILRERGLRMPEAIFIQTVTGESPDDEDVTSPANSDIYMIPDGGTIREVPWYKEPTAAVISDCVYANGNPVDIAPR